MPPPTPMSEGGTKLDCPICMDKVGSENGHLTLACRHSFCRTCLATHTSRQQRHQMAASCPLCKRECSAAEVSACGAAKEMQEESEDEEEGRVMVLVQFEGEDGEEGYWVEFHGDELDDSDEDELYGEHDDDDDEEEEEGENDAGGERQLRHIFIEDGEDEGEAGGPPPGVVAEARAARRRTAMLRQREAARAALLEGMPEGDEDDEEEEEDDDDDDVDDDPRPYGGWQWSVSHNAWVGGAHCSRPPPTRAPAEGEWEATGLGDPLEGRMLLAEEDVLLMEANEAADLQMEEDEYWRERGEHEEL